MDSHSTKSPKPQFIIAVRTCQAGSARAWWGAETGTQIVQTVAAALWYLAPILRAARKALRGQVYHALNRDAAQRLCPTFSSVGAPESRRLAAQSAKLSNRVLGRPNHSR